MKRAYVYVIITALLFGTMEVSCKIGGAELDPFQLTFLRFAIGGIVLLPFAWIQLKRNNVKLTGKDLATLAGVGILGVTISMSMFQFSIMMCNASTVSVLICVNPFFTMIFAHFLTSEKLTRHKVMVLVIALVGIMFMLRPWDIQEGNSIGGMMLMIGSAFVFGLYTVVGKVSQEKLGLYAQTSISFLFGAAALLILILVMGRPVMAGVTEDMPVVLYTGVMVTGLGYYCYFKAIELGGASTGAFAFFLKPAIAPIIAVIVLHETILWNTVIGIGLVLVASLLNILHQKKLSAQRIAEEHRLKANREAEDEPNKH
ncbi:MAG: DMT family transporter [Clostridia bacterium]|nr:DMT family transporter [Clostridia bacterium]